MLTVACAWARTGTKLCGAGGRGACVSQPVCVISRLRRCTALHRARAAGGGAEHDVQMEGPRAYIWELVRPQTAG